MMIWLFALALALLAYWHRRRAGSALYPPVLFAGLWAGMLVAIALSGDAFYPLSEKTMWILVLGSVAFGLGSETVSWVKKTKASVQASTAALASYEYRVPIDLVLNVGMGVLIAALPFYWQLIQQIVAKSDDLNFWVGLRTEITGADGTGLGIFAYLGAFASFLVVLSVYQLNVQPSLWGRVRLVLLMALALSLHLGSGGRIESMTLFFTMAVVAWIRANRIRIGPAAIGVFLALAIFAVMAVLLGKGADRDSPLRDNLETLSITVRHYALSGVVGLDRYVRGFVNLTPGAHTFRFFAALAQALGAKVEVTELVMPMVDVPDQTNVYTMFLPYFVDFGWLGVTTIPFGLGVAASLLYHGARRGQAPFCILYACFVGSLFLCIANDMFVVATSHWVQIGAYTTLLFRRARQGSTLNAPERATTRLYPFARPLPPLAERR